MNGTKRIQLTKFLLAWPPPCRPPAPGGPPASRQPPRRAAPPRPSLFGCDRSVRPGSVAFGRLRAVPVRAPPFGPAKAFGGAFGRARLSSPPPPAAFGRDRKRLERVRDSSTPRAGPLGDSAPFGRARAGRPELSGIASGRGLGRVPRWDWPAGRQRGPRASPAIGRGPATLGTLRAPSEALGPPGGGAFGTARLRSAPLGRPPPSARAASGGPPHRPGALSERVGAARAGWVPLPPPSPKPLPGRPAWRTPTRRPSSWA